LVVYPSWGFVAISLVSVAVLGWFAFSSVLDSEDARFFRRLDIADRENGFDLLREIHKRVMKLEDSQREILSRLDHVEQEDESEG
jgi:hypothetical protein